MYPPLVAVMLVLTVSARPARAQDPPDLLDDVVSRHRAAVESIRSFSCKHTVKEEYADGRVTVTAPGEYWRAGDDVRAKWRTGDKWCDGLISDMRVVTLSGAVGRKATAASIAPDRGTALGVADPWVNAPFVFFAAPGKATRPMAFWDLLLQHEAKGAKRVREGQEEAVVVEVEISPSIREYWFDPRHNYLIKKVVARSDQSSATSEVVRFKEAAPGVFFPEAVVLKSYRAGNLLSTRTTTFSDVRVNAPMPDRMFRLDLPANTEVHDLIQGKKYVTDAAGRPTGAGEDLPHPPPPRAPAAQPRIPRPETKSEPTHWTELVLPASLGILAIGVGAWVIQRWRAQGQRLDNVPRRPR
jgi:hypothetical protein